MTIATQKFQTVTLANRPSAATYGRGFVVISDQANAMYYSDGSTWTAVSPSYADRPWVLNGLGDSITARNSYHPVDIDYTIPGIPLWSAGTQFSLNNVCRNSLGQLFYCTTAGATGATEPSWSATSTTSDGSVVWTAYLAYGGRDATSFLWQAEKFSNGGLVFDQSKGYRFPEFSLMKVVVVTRGSGYSSADTLTFSVSGIRATLNINPIDGGIDSVTLVNCGRNASGALTYTLNTSTGSGAVLSLVHTNSGTFGVSGCTTTDCVARLPDAVASDVDIFTVLAGTNDATLNVTTFADADTQYAVAITNLKTIYETLTRAGKKVIAIPILPRTGLTAPKLAFIQRVNRWIRAYANRETWANPSAIQIGLADATRYLTDGSAAFSPVGGTGGTIGSVTVDGLHPSPLGAQYIGYAVVEAAKLWVNVPPARARSASYSDGYSLSYNEGGNLLEGLPWRASTVYAVGDQVYNDSAPVKVYRCTAGGTSAGSGGPTGTGTPTDGGVTWAYVRDAGLSVFGVGSGGTNTAAGGIAYVGNLAKHLTLARQTGTASGTITEVIESPWSNGQTGQRQVISFDLSGGGATELWRVLVTSAAIANMSVQSADIANKYFFFEVELQLSAVSNMYQPYIQLFGQSAILSNYDGFGNYSGGGGAAGYEIMPSNGGMLTLPNNGIMTLRTQPMQFPVGLTTVNSGIYFGFNATTSATATVKINHMAIRKAYV